MELIQEEKRLAVFVYFILKEIDDFREHVVRVSSQYKAQTPLKENLKDRHVAIHLHFAEDYRCMLQEEVQSAYWNTSTVTLRPAVVYFCHADRVKVNFVFVSNKTRHDTTYIFALLKKLIPQVNFLVPNVTHYRFFSNSPTSQYRNKTVFKITSYQNEYFGLVASWNYSEVGHGKGPCDAIRSTSKHQPDMAVGHGQVVIQDALDVFAWASSQQGCINYLFIWVEDYEDSEKFSAVLRNDMQAVKGTMNVYAVKSAGPNKIKIRETSCYCQNYYSGKNLCDEWKEINLIRGKPQEGNVIIIEHYPTIPFNS